MPENKIPTVLFEIIDQKDSGVFLADTRGSASETQLRGSIVTWIPRTGFRCEMIKNETTGITTPTNIEIRFIKNSREIDKEKQELAKIQPNPKADTIEFRNNNMLISRQGDTESKYDYLMNAFYNKDAPNRPESATAIYRMIELDKNAEILMEDDDDAFRAMEITQSLKIKTGLKSPKYKYNEERIDSISNLLGVVAESYEQKAFSINAFAKSQPRNFLKKVENFEQAILTEVTQALKANVVVFDKNAAMFPDDLRIIKDFGSIKMSGDAKTNALADFLKTDEGAHSLTMLRAKMDFKKNEDLK